MSGSGVVRRKKHMRQAIELKREASKDFTLMLVLACVFFAAIAGYSFAVRFGVIEDQPLAQGVALIAAIIIGGVSLRHSKKRRKFLDFIDEYGITKEEVSQQMKAC